MKQQKPDVMYKTDHITENASTVKTNRKQILFCGTEYCGGDR